MIKEYGLVTTTTVKEILDFLNSMVEEDPKAVTALCEARVSCNYGMANHPTVAVSDTEDGFKMGVLGVLNGLVRTILGGEFSLYAQYGDDDVVTSFGIYKDGKVYNPE